MKNPFLQQRSIFNKVQKPSTNQVQKQTKPDTNLNKPTYNNLPLQKQSSNNPSNLGYKSNLGNTQSKQPSSAYGYSQENSNPVLSNKYVSSQKITFGDPYSAEGNHAERTSGYFNMPNAQLNNNLASNRMMHQTNSYQPQKPGVRKNNFFQSGADIKNPTSKDAFNYNKQKLPTTKQYQKQEKFYGTSSNMSDFTPPPINNFTTTPLQQNKYQSFKPTNYEYKKTKPYETQNEYGEGKKYEQNNNKYGQSNNKYGQTNKYTKQSDNFFSKQENQAYKYKSPPKDEFPGRNSNQTPKNDLSYRFKQNNYNQLSPIGQVSRHKINQDSLLNLDGLINEGQIDKLLAQSRTQEELIRLLGMDTSAIRRSQQPTNRNQNQRNQRNQNNQYQSYKNYQQQTQYKNYKQQPISNYNAYDDNKKYPQPLNNYRNESNHIKPYQFQQQENYGYKNSTTQIKKQTQCITPYSQRQKQYQDDQPKVFNYAEQTNFNKKINQSSKKQNNYIGSNSSFNNTNQQQFIATGGGGNLNLYQDKNSNQVNLAPSQRQQKQKRIFQIQVNHQAQSLNEQAQFDLQKIVQNQVQKYVYQQEGINPNKNSDKRVFMTVNQKIYTKKYHLEEL